MKGRWRSGLETNDGFWQYDVFISHAGEDKVFAHRLRDGFNSVGLDAFVDQADLLGGADADTQMMGAVTKAPIGLALLSKEYLRKEWPLRELRLIVGEDTLLPVLYNISYEEAKKALVEGHQETEGADLQQWSTLVKKVLRTTAVEDPYRSSDKLPFVELIVFTAVGLCVSKRCPRLIEHFESNLHVTPCALKFIQRVQQASLSLSSSTSFLKLNGEQKLKAQEWSSKLNAYLAHT